MARARDAGRQKRVTRRIVAIAGSSVALVLLAALAGIRVVLTPSMPRGLYLARPLRGDPARGDTVAVCLSETYAAFARGRGYIAAGTACPGRAQTLTKAILAVAGDTVRVTPRGIVIGTQVLPNSALRRVDSAGRPLPGVEGIHVVPPGHVWVGSTFDPASFDSRYFGPVPASSLVSRRRPIWTEAADARD
jgi:conjugative transfer signal peptidase TraF